MVLHGQIISQVGRQIVKGLTRYYRLEGKAFNKLYTGFPRSKTIGRGVRHGLTVGSVAGSFINQDDNNLNGGFQKIQQRERAQTRSPYQTRQRFSRRSSFECGPERRPGSFRRRSRFSKY